MPEELGLRAAALVERWRRLPPPDPAPVRRDIDALIDKDALIDNDA